MVRPYANGARNEKIKSMKTTCNLFIPVMLGVVIALLNTGCDQSADDDADYDANLINQHMETDVTFNERYRPQFHFTPKINWMNDPNGLVYYEGQYHLFFQYNPFGNRWGYMSWGHAVSDDMVHWEHRPVAIPYGKEEEEGIFSGGALVDHNNTSGLGDGDREPIIAIYTSHYTREDGSTWQAQSLAYSNDGGDTFTKYEGNPVLEFDDPDFRDPNVMWDEQSEQWVMVVALSTQNKVQFYASDNLIDWKYLSDFGPEGAVDGIWECPDLFQLAVDGDPNNMKWLLHVDMNPGAIAGGSGSQFFVGEWNGTEFIPDESISGGDVLWADYGTDFYAAISWDNIPEDDGRRLWVGWMNNWTYANDIPTYPWRSAQSIPRSVHLETRDGNIKVIQRPIEELQSLREKHISVEDINVSAGNHSLEGRDLSGKAYEFIVELDPGDSDVVGFRLRSGVEEETLVGYDAIAGTVFVDRSHSGEDSFHEEFAQRNDTSVNLKEGKIKLHVFVDWSSVEVFVNDGERVITNRIFPDPDSQGISLFAEGGNASADKLDFWTLKSIWSNKSLN